MRNIVEQGQTSGSRDTTVLSGWSCASRCTMWISVPTPITLLAGAASTQSRMRSVEPAPPPPPPRPAGPPPPEGGGRGGAPPGPPPPPPGGEPGGGTPGGRGGPPPRTAPAGRGGTGGGPAPPPRHSRNVASLTSRS